MFFFFRTQKTGVLNTDQGPGGSELKRFLPGQGVEKKQRKRKGETRMITLEETNVRSGEVLQLEGVSPKKWMMFFVRMRKCEILGGGNSKIFYFHPEPWGR